MERAACILFMGLTIYLQVSRMEFQVTFVIINYINKAIKNEEKLQIDLRNSAVISLFK